MKKKHPTVGPQSVTNALASGLVSGWLAERWIVCPQVPDFHVDYVIEPVFGGELSGTKFCAQQKGHKTVRAARGVLKEPMKTKHLIYYAEKERLPVFLFVVDTGAKRGYFLFLQEWIDANLSADELRSKRKCAVSVPEGNDMGNAEALETEVARSFAYMRRKHPGSVADAITHDLGKMSSLDPRWDFKLNVIDGTRHYTLSPRQEIEMSIQLAGPAAHAFAELHDFGRPLAASGPDVKITGSPLFDGRPLAKFAFKPRNALVAEFRIWTEGAEGFSLTLPATITRGAVGLLFAGEWSRGPIRLEMKVPSASLAEGIGKGTLNLSWAFERWQGHPVTALPYLDEMRHLSTSTHARQSISCELRFNGKRMVHGAFDTSREDSAFLYCAQVTDHACRMRDISGATGIPMQFPQPDGIDEDELFNVEFAHAIVTGGSFECDASAFTARSEFIFKESAGMSRAIMFEKLDQVPVEAEFTVIRASEEVSIHGTKVRLGALWHTIRRPKIEVTEQSRADFLAFRSESFSVRISGTESSESHIKRAAVDPSP